MLVARAPRLRVALCPRYIRALLGSRLVLLGRLPPRRRQTVDGMSPRGSERHLGRDAAPFGEHSDDADDAMYSKPSLHLHAALFGGQGGRCAPQAYASPAALRFAQALHISQLEELDCMPTDMDDELCDQYNTDSAVNTTNLQSASDTVAQIFMAQMDSYYATASQLIDQKPLAQFMSGAVGHSQGSAAAIAVAAAGDSLATLEAYAR